MATTWHDIKLATLQKMFAADGSTIPTDESTADYIASMPYACNEALQLLSTAGKFIIRSVCVAHFPVPSIAADYGTDNIMTLYDDSCSFEYDGVRSFAMDVFGTGEINIYIGQTLNRTISVDGNTGFSEVKMNLQNEEKQKVRFEFVTNLQMSVKAIGIYACNFASDEEIPPYRKYIRYRMKDIAPDFYQLDDNQIVYEGGSNEHYLKPSEYFQEGNKVLVLPRSKAGNYTIYYKAYPEQITMETEDDYELPVDPEVAALLPLYIASQLYKDDDNGIATAYRNEFEVAFERLSQKADVPAAEHFVSESGWI